MNKASVFIFTALIFLAPVSYCDDDINSPQIMRVDGQAASIDWVKSTLVVKLSNDEITFYVPDDAKITKGPDEIPLSEIENFDYVTVQYYDTSPGPLKAVNISIRTAIYTYD